MFSKLFITLLISCLFFTLNSCSLSETMYPSQLGAGEFYAIQFKGGDIDSQESIILKPRKIMTTEITEVFLDDKGSNISEENIRFIIDGFENAYNGMINTFGTHTDVDNNRKVIIIFFDINMGISSSEYVAGYFSSVDLIKGYGNSAEILYVDSANVDEENREAVLGTVVHEFQHLIDYNMNDIRLGKSSDLWINEARSEAANMIYAQNGNIPENRLSIYNSYKAIKNGNYFYKWDNITDTATSSLFMYWLYAQANNKVNGIEKGIIRDIAYSRKSYGYQSVVEAVNKNISTRKNASWDDILFAWLASNQANKITSLDGYSSLNLNLKVFAGGDANLYPGDAIISGKRPILFSDNTNIIIRSANITDGKTLYITINKSTDINGKSVVIGVPEPREESLEDNQNISILPKTPESRIKHVPQGRIKVKF